MTRSTLRLIRLRWQLYWNTFRNLPWSRKLFSILALFFLLMFAGFLGFMSWGAFRLVREPAFINALHEAGLNLSAENIYELLPGLFFTSAFLLGLFANLGSLLQTLFLSGDLEFLLAAPIQPRAVFLSKLLQAILPSFVLMALITLPGLFGLGINQGYNILFYLFQPVFVFGLVTVGAGLSSLLVMALVRVIPPRRAVEALAFVGGTTAFICSQSGQFAGEIGETVLQSEQFAGAFSRLLSMTSIWNPLSWPGQALIGIGKGAWLSGFLYTTGTLLLSGLLFGLTLTAAERLYYTGWSRVQVGTRAKKKKRARKPSENQRAAFFTRPWYWLPAPARAVVLKDVRLFRRDLRNLSQLVFPIVLAVIWTFTFLRDGGPESQAIGMIANTGGFGFALFIGFSFASRFGMGSFSLEGKQWWIIKAAPIAPRHLLLAKYLMTFIPPFLFGLLYLAITSLTGSKSLWMLIYQVLAVTVVMAGISGLLLAFGIWGAKFDWKNPNEAQGGGMGCLATFAGFLSLGFLGAIFGGLPILANFVDWSPWIVYPGGIFAGTVASALIGGVPLAIAANRLPRLGEE